MGELGKSWSKGTNLQLKDKFWGSNARPCDYS